MGCWLYLAIGLYINMSTTSDQRLYIYKVISICLYRSKKDKHLYIVPDQSETQLNRSFAELELFTENTTDVVWKFVRNLQHRPYETTLQTFAKLTDTWCKYFEVTLNHHDCYKCNSKFVSDYYILPSITILGLCTSYRRKERYWYLNGKEIEQYLNKNFTIVFRINRNRNWNWNQSYSEFPNLYWHLLFILVVCKDWCLYSIPLHIATGRALLILKVYYSRCNNSFFGYGLLSTCLR
jgi:hypothetical protein